MQLIQEWQGTRSLISFDNWFTEVVLIKGISLGNMIRNKSPGQRRLGRMEMNVNHIKDKHH